jgi:hypothetical protein
LNIFHFSRQADRRASRALEISPEISPDSPPLPAAFASAFRGSVVLAANPLLPIVPVAPAVTAAVAAASARVTRTVSFDAEPNSDMTTPAETIATKAPTTDAHATEEPATETPMAEAPAMRRPVARKKSKCLLEEAELEALRENSEVGALRPSVLLEPVESQLQALLDQAAALQQYRDETAGGADQEASRQHAVMIRRMDEEENDQEAAAAELAEYKTARRTLLEQLEEEEHPKPPPLHVGDADDLEWRDRLQRSSSLEQDARDALKHAQHQAWLAEREREAQQVGDTASRLREELARLDREHQEHVASQAQEAQVEALLAGAFVVPDKETAHARIQVRG